MEIIIYVFFCFDFIDKGRPAYSTHLESTQECTLRDFPGGPVAKTPHC